MKVVKKVCEEQGLPFSKIDKNGNLAKVKYLGKQYFFVYTTTPFNREDTQHICNDKFFTYETLKGSRLMPKTQKYLRPDLDPTWHDKIEFSSNANIVSDIEKNFDYPFIIKMNSGSLGRNVFKCRNKKDLNNAVNKVFKEDWALLAQELVEKHKEFRVMIVNNSVEFFYTKGGGEFYYKGDSFFKETKAFLDPLQGKIDLGWAGLDVVLDKKGKLHLIEINTKPSLISAIRSKKTEEVKKLYKKAFKMVFK